MTKEELKKEAEESAKKFFGKPTDLVDLDNLRIFKNGYLASAEPREKRIEELEQQIEKMKCCGNCKHKKSEVDRCELLMYTMNDCLCKNKDKWELREIKEK